MIEHNGYIGSVEYSPEDEVFHGRIINIRGVVTFEGTSVRELKKAFREAVDDYLDLCAKHGEKPEKPYSGALRLRMDPDLHSRAANAAARSGKSLNSFIVESVERAVHAR